MRPNSERAQLAVKMIWIVLVIQVIAIILDLIQLNILKEIAAGESVAHRVTEANDARQSYISISFMIAWIISGVTFIQWFRRAYYNLQTLVDDLSWDESWVVGAWIIPILNLYRPFQMMRELYSRSIIYLSETGLENDMKVSLTPVAWWWFIWIFRIALNAVIATFLILNPENDQMLNITRMNIIGGLLLIPLAVITVTVIRNYSVVEARLEQLPS